MNNYTLKLAQLLQGAQPSQGGLSVGDYPNPYGLRAYQNHNGTYGGQMMPKSTGWLGIHKSPKGESVTEFSVENNNMSFPSLVPGLNTQEINQIVRHQNVTPSAYKKAEEFALQRQSQGLSPFKDIWDK